MQVRVISVPVQDQAKVFNDTCGNNIQLVEMS